MKNNKQNIKPNNNQNIKPNNNQNTKPNSNQNAKPNNNQNAKPNNNQNTKPNNNQNTKPNNNQNTKSNNNPIKQDNDTEPKIIDGGIANESILYSDLTKSEEKKETEAVIVAKYSIFIILGTSIVVILICFKMLTGVLSGESTTFYQELIKCIISLFSTILGFVLGYFYGNKN